MRTQFPAHYSKLITELRKIDSHGKASLIAVSDVGERMTKKCRTTKLPPPEWSVGLICITRSVVNIDHDYSKAVNNQIKKNGFPAVFEAEESTVSDPVEGFPNLVLRQGKTNPDQLYVRVFIEMSGPSKMDTVYLNGRGEIVTDLVTEEFKDNFFPKKYGSVKQMVHGAAKETKPREYKADNIIYLQKGDCLFNNLSQDLYELFNLEAVPA